MEEHRKHFLNGVMAAIGTVVSWFGAHGQIIDSTISRLSLYGGFIVVLWSLRNCYRQWRRNRLNRD